MGFFSLTVPPFFKLCYDYKFLVGKSGNKHNPTSRERKAALPVGLGGVSSLLQRLRSQCGEPATVLGTGGTVWPGPCPPGDSANAGDPQGQQ